MLCCGMVAAVTACTDKWDDHYEGQTTAAYGISENTLWQAVKANTELSNFVSVAEACGFDRTLNASQVLTLFAPTNDRFTADQARALIDQYRSQKSSGTLEDDNTVVKEFIQNHIALYNYSVAEQSSDSIRMMNGKKVQLKSSSVGNAALLTKNQLFSNGILFTIDKPVEYLPNVFEYIRKDTDFDSLRTFLYSGDSLISGRSKPLFYYKDFRADLSVAGSVKDGKTEYLDSIFIQRNRLFDTLGDLNVEDSTYIFLAPTNNVWSQLVEEYEPYFNYAADVENRDSLVYLNTRMAIMTGTAFSRTFNSDRALQDSAMSVNCVKEYALRVANWGGPYEYYQYYKPLSPNGALEGAEIIPCSNGEVRKAAKWNIDKRMTFNRFIVIEAEHNYNVKGVQREYSQMTKDSVDMASIEYCPVLSENKFYDRVWNNGFAQVTPSVSNNYDITFFLRDVLSNIGYDIYVVTAPALANDSNATEVERLPTKIRCTISSPGAKDFRSSDISTTADNIDYLLVAEDYKFNTCTYGINSDDRQATMKIESRVSSRENDKTFTRTMRIDCILLVPHGSLKIVDSVLGVTDEPAVLLYPHGEYDDRPYKYWYMLR